MTRPAPITESVREVALCRAGAGIGSRLPPFSWIGSNGIAAPSTLLMSFQIAMNVPPFEFVTAGSENCLKGTQYLYQRSKCRHAARGAPQGGDIRRLQCLSFREVACG